MQRLLIGVWLLAAPVVVPAQQEAKPAAPQDAAAAHAQLVRDFDAAVAAWRESARKRAAEAQKAAAEGKPFPAFPMAPPSAEFIARAEALAKEFAGKDDAVRFLDFICTNATQERDAVIKAVRALRADHGKSPAVRRALDHLQSAFWMDGKADAMALLDAVVDGNPDPDTRAHALLVRGDFRLQFAATAEQRKAAEDDLRAVSKTTGDADLNKRAKGALFDVENLQVGCKAPDIVAKDTDGAAMKLSDYRGKVILLDFWGFW